MSMSELWRRCLRISTQAGSSFAIDGKIMVLPKGVDKASGLAAALRKLKLSCDEVLAAGDAENDVALFRACSCGVAVVPSSSLDVVRAPASWKLSSGTLRTELIQADTRR
jgi:hydroxymethylpyrimidine pyrophosphatase-like HAD family hydrolase